MADYLTQEQAIAKIQACVDREGSQVEAARKRDISVQYLNNLLLGRAPLSANMARKFGFRKLDSMYVQEQTHAE